MTSRWDIVVAGAGPVGLLAANLLGQAGMKTLLIEKETAPRASSRAIGIMPPSLAIMGQVGLADAFLENGVSVATAHVHGAQRYLGAVHFNDLDGPYPHLLSMPQDRTEVILHNGLSRRDTVTVERGCFVIGAHQTETSVRLILDGPAEKSIEATFVLGCDGDNSRLREQQHLRCDKQRFRHTFLMGDYTDRTDLGSDAHLFFTPLGAVESFPMPGGIRRWIIQTTKFESTPPKGLIEKTVAKRAGHTLRFEDRRWQSPFGIKRQLCRPYYKGRIVFCGDAAHVMPPIGGQGMNTGFADAWMAVQLLTHIIKSSAPHEPLFSLYNQCRAKAARAATRRAFLSMRIGTLRGSFASALRNGLIHLALCTALRQYLPRHFAMQTIPFGTIDKMRSALVGHLPTDQSDFDDA